MLAPSLEAGGAERVISHPAPADTDFHELPAAVRRVALDVWTGVGLRLQPMKLRRRRRHALRELRPAVAASFILNMNLLSLEGGRGLGMPQVVCERIDPAYPFGRAWKALRRALHPRAAEES